METQASPTEVTPVAQPPTNIKGPLSDPVIRNSLADAFLSHWRRKKGYRKPKPKYVAAELASVAKYHPGAEGEYDKDIKTITVKFTTPSLVLTCEKTGASKDLGQFEVTIITQQKPSSVTIIARALTPRPAVDSPDVTHPHVQRHRICMGDWKTVINSNAISGHFSVAADMILNLLSTYNPGSPYRRLDEWNGYRCTNCDATARAAPRICGRCREATCSYCVGANCMSCGTSFHEDCISRCSNCEWRGCASHLQDGECPNCYYSHEEEEEEEDDEEPEPEDEEYEDEQETEATPQIVQREWRDDAGQPCATCRQRFDPRGLFEGLCSYCYGTA